MKESSRQREEICKGPGVRKCVQGQQGASRPVGLLLLLTLTREIGSEVGRHLPAQAGL